MANDVFANGREISCKAASGKSRAAFPDVCFTPPQTPATPLGAPIPYPNTGEASDTAKGSKKVKITRKEVMRKNKSYFKKSSGDMAGRAPKKGILTTQTKGKVYFTSWSMDVKVEGKNVVRHFDLTTHNHASAPGNTPPWGYMDTMNMKVGGVQDPCKGQREDVTKKCAECQTKNTYETGKRKGAINQTGMQKCMCEPGECKDARKCVLVPYNRGCCDGKTGHHVVPKHCFKQRPSEGGNPYKGCENYNPDDAPCICVTGKDKSKKHLDHAKIHDQMDTFEDTLRDKQAGIWSYNQAADAGAKSVQVVLGCDEKCTRAQLDKYHNKEANIPKGTDLRADSAGQRASSADLKIATKSGGAV